MKNGHMVYTVLVLWHNVQVYTDAVGALAVKKVRHLTDLSCMFFFLLLA